MKKERLRHYASLMAAGSESPWVTFMLFWVFFVDAIIMVIPTDPLLGAALGLNHRHYKKWIIASVLGFLLGLGFAAWVLNSHFQPWAFSILDHYGYLDKVQTWMAGRETVGYWTLTFGVLTFFPCFLTLVAGNLVGLNPIAIWAIAGGAKLLKLGITILVIFTGSKKLKKWLGLYAKTSV